MSLRKSIYMLVFFITLLAVLQTGCLNNGYSSNPIASKISKLDTANVVFKIAVPGQPKFKSSILANIASPTTVTFRIKLINYGNVFQPFSTVIKKAIAQNGSATVIFQGLPLTTVVGEIHLENGSIASYTDFHGALDLGIGSNTLELSPVGSLMRQDVVANAIANIVASSTLFLNASYTLALDISNIVSNLLLDSDAAYEEVISNFSNKNGLPYVEIVLPINNREYKLGESIDIVASATDLDGSIFKVEFFQNEKKIGEKSTSPLSMSWLPNSIGSYTLLVKAIDNTTAVKLSAPINVSVGAVAKTFSIIYNTNGGSSGDVPVDNITYESGSTVAIKSNTGNLVKTGYTFEGWNTKADGSGITYPTSSTFAIGVANVNLYANWKEILPLIYFTNQLDYKYVVCGENINLEVLPSDAGGNISKVEFLLDGVSLFAKTSPPWSHTWSSSIPSNYSFVAKASNSAGESLVQLSINVKRGLAFPEPIGKKIIFVGTWWGEGLTETGDFNLIASITALDNLNGPVSPALRFARNGKKKKMPKVRKGLPIQELLDSYSLTPQIPAIRSKSFLRASLSDEPIMSVKRFRSKIGGIYGSADFYKLAQNDECIVYAMRDYSNDTPCITSYKAEIAADAFGVTNTFNSSNQSIANCTRASFGHEWQVDGGRDNESRVIILVFDEALCLTNTWGYYRPVDSSFDEGVNDSNGGEIIYVSDDAFVNDNFMALSTISHEFQHMVQDNMGRIRDGAFSGDASQLFFNEGCSLLSEELNGFGLNASGGAHSDFANAVYEGLVSFWHWPVASWDGATCDYGRGYLFVRYLKQKLGQDGLKQLIANSATKSHIESALPSGCESFFKQWSLAMLLTGKNGNISEELQYEGLNFYKIFTTRDGQVITLNGPTLLDKELSDFNEISMACAKGTNMCLEVKSELLSTWSGKFFIDFKQMGVSIQAVELQNDAVVAIHSDDWLNSPN